MEWEWISRTWQARRIPILSWLIHVIILLLCLSYVPEWPLSVILAISWVISAASSIWLSTERRGAALILTLVSAILARKTFLYVLLTISCAMGDCI